MERVDYESILVQDLIGFHQDKTLNITPWYQRRSVWSDPQRAYLINTIFEKKPVPSIYIRHKIDVEKDRSVKEVVDGQQRIRTIISYKAGEFPALHPSHKRKVSYSDLTGQQKHDFLATALSVGYLIGADDRDVIEIFGRINSISKTLNPQEKRNAQYSGDFKQFCLSQAVKRLSFWRSTGIFSGNEIARMQEVQFMSDLTINMIEGLIDYSATKIDSYYKRFDNDFPEADEISDRLDKLFAKLAALPQETFSETIFKQYQVAFSLMVALDQLRERAISEDKISQVVRDVDNEIVAFGEAATLEEQETRILDAFGKGNLHRIVKRRIRHELLIKYFS